MALSDIQIRKARATSKPIKLTDSHGLYVQVKPNGSKLWRYRYELAGKENIFAIGQYPEVGLQAARKARDDARALVKTGIHPAHARRTKIEQTIEAGRETFQAIADEWLEKKKKIWTQRHYIEVSRMMKADAYPAIGTHPARSITARSILDLMLKVEGRGSPAMAIKVRQSISSIFQYAVITQRADADPAAVLRGVVAKPATEHSRALSVDELSGIYRGLPKYQSRRTALAIKLLMMLFPRTIELCRAEWREIDLDAAEWRIPAEKIKARRLHIVPLPTQAIEILQELKEMHGGIGYVLPILHSNSKNGHMSRATINAAMKYLLPDNPKPVTGHDFRATASTRLHETGWRDEVIEMQLAHKDKNQTRGAYNHAEYMSERRKMMQAWANWLGTIEAKTPGGTAMPAENVAKA
jgi:integrase